MPGIARRVVFPVLGLVLAGVLTWISGCGTTAVPTASPPANTQPGVSGNQRPTFRFINPDRSVSVSVGATFVISWTDSDPDDSAAIDLLLDPDTSNNSGNELIILAGRNEDGDLFNDDSFEFDSAAVPVGTYILRALINDGVNPEVIVNAPGTFSIVPIGTAPLNAPPTIRITQPTFNRSVANGDRLLIQWEDSDPEDNALIILTLDFDDSPNNDNPAACDGVSDCIFLTNALEDPDPNPADPNDPNPLADSFFLDVNVTRIPVRTDGKPYFLKATATDQENPPVHTYATAQIFVLTLAEPKRSRAGAPLQPVDLGNTGLVVSGAQFQGFAPGDWMGWRGRTVGDFDGDGADDFVMVARFGRIGSGGPNVGQAFITYGLPPLSGANRGERFGGKIRVNQIATGISGAILDAPNAGLGTFSLEGPRSPDNLIQGGPNLGITDVAFMPDDELVPGGAASAISGDLLPEIVFGIPYTDGILQARDDDPGDTDEDDEETPEFEGLGCYADPYVNNLSDTPPQDDPFQASASTWERLGCAIMLYSSNRDNAGAISPNRLDSTSLNLENVGQQSELRGALGATDPVVEAGGRASGARFQVGLYDHLCENQFFCPTGSYQGPIMAEYGRTVDSLPDMTLDQTAELIISAPRNELDIVEAIAEYGLFSSHVQSRALFGSVKVYFGQNFRNQGENFPTGGGSGNSVLPYIASGSAQCGESSDDRVRDFTDASGFEIAAENPNDRLGYARYAGDFNNDFVPDIVMGAPLASANFVTEAGKAYILFGKPSISGLGDVFLENLDDPDRRPPTLRIMGEHEGDHLGIVQGLQQDFNGDSIDDTVIASGDYDCPNCDPADCPVDDPTCCEDCGAVAIIFGIDCRDLNSSCEVDADNDYLFSEIGSPALPGLVFYGSPGHKLGGGSFTYNGVTLFAEHGISGSGTYNASGVTRGADYNGDGIGDLLILAPGARPVVSQQERLGAVYVVFGQQDVWDSVDPSQNVFTLDPTAGEGDIGTSRLPGIVFASPYQSGTLDEAAPLSVGFLGDINADGFSDIFIGNPLADFVQPLFPAARRKDAGEAYLIYGSNFGCNNPSNWPNAECFPATP